MASNEETGLPRRPSRAALWAFAFVIVVALAPSIGTLTAGLISDDGAALGYVHRMGPFADWLRPEYDLHSVRFWRPMVTLSLGLQEALSGAAPMPLRLFNLLGHVATAVLVLVLARQLGARWLGASLVAALVGLFPAQGGTVAWIVGRVDSQCVPLVLGALVATLSGRPLWAGLLCFLALATKEIAVAAPFAAALLLWARARGTTEPVPARAWRAWWVMVVVIAATVVLRRLALGTWVGGYAGGLGTSFPDGIGAAEVRAVVTAFAEPMAWLLSALGLALVLLMVARRSPLGLVLVVLAGLAGLAPLLRSLAPGVLGAEHERTLMLADSLLCLALAMLFVGGLPRWVSRAGLVLVLALGVERGLAAVHNTQAWARAGNDAEALVRETRATLDALVLEPSSRPVLTARAPRIEDGAYVLHFGVADRFRAPFVQTPRPVWPWRPLFEAPGMQRQSVTQVEHDLRWPFERGHRTVPALVVRRAEPELQGAPLGDLELSTRLVQEPGPLLACEGDFPGARFEVLLFTELGYGIGLFGGPKQSGELHALPAGTVPPPFWGVISLRELLMLRPMGGTSGGTPLYEVLALAADFGAREAYLELRAVDDARGKLDRPVGASPWIHLVWGPDLREALMPFDTFR